jgi:hypothetical protein
LFPSLDPMLGRSQSLYALCTGYMRELGDESCKADADVWLKAETRPGDGTHIYFAMLQMCYV